MADNYSKATLQPDVRLNDELRAVLRATGADFELGDEGREYVYWEMSFVECIEPEWTEPGQVPERWHNASMEDVLRAVLELNPGVELLTVEGASTCSKMRPGEFGGFGLYVTRDEYCWINTAAVNLKGGRLGSTVAVQRFPEAA